MLCTQSGPVANLSGGFGSRIISSGGSPPVNTVTPVITSNGDLANPKPGDVWTCDGGTWTGSPTLTYSWLYTDNGNPVSGSPKNQQTYTVVAGDISETGFCEVTGTNAHGSAQANSNSSGTVVARASHWFGDSWTTGLGVDPTQRFSTLVSGVEGRTEDNHGINGSQIADEANTVCAVTIASGDVSFYTAGYNDMRNYGTDASALAVNLTALQYLAARIAIPDANRLKYDDASITCVGSWSVDATDFIGGVKYTTTPGDTASFSFTGDALVVGWLQITGASGVFDISVDGSSVGTFSSARSIAATGNGTTYNPASSVVIGLSSGSHSVVLTLSSGSALYFSFAAGINSAAKPNAVCYLSGTSKMPTAGYAAGGANYSAGSDAAAVAYSAMVATVASNLHGAGLHVYATTFDCPVTEFQSDNIHPSVAGHADIATADETFIAANPFP